MRDFAAVDGSTIQTQEFSRFMERLDQKGEAKNTLKFCRTLFHKTRQEFLRDYTQYASFGETLSKGKYNCLTGTTLYAMLWNISIFNTPLSKPTITFFCSLTTDEGGALFEATDPLHGFVTNARN